jgi:hypothetical protein
MNRKSIMLLSFCICLCLPLVVTADEVTMTFSRDFPGHRLHSDQQYLMGETYDMLRMEGMDLTVIPGQPALPVEVMNVYVPRGKAISSVRVTSATSHMLSGGYLIMPVQQQVPTSSRRLAEPVLPD